MIKVKIYNLLSIKKCINEYRREQKDENRFKRL